MILLAGLIGFFVANICHHRHLSRPRDHKMSIFVLILNPGFSFEDLKLVLELLQLSLIIQAIFKLMFIELVFEEELDAAKSVLEARLPHHVIF